MHRGLPEGMSCAARGLALIVANPDVVVILTAEARPGHESIEDPKGLFVFTDLDEDRPQIRAIVASSGF
jgi:hypothetical protein